MVALFSGGAIFLTICMEGGLVAYIIKIDGSDGMRMVAWYWLLVAGVIGAVAGMLTTALCVIARQDESQSDIDRK